MRNLLKVRINKNIYQSGFTLLELLVVFGIIAVSAIFTAPYLQDWNKRSSFENSVSEIVTLLYQVKNESFLKSTTTKIVANKDGDNYDFEIFEASTPITDCAATTTWTEISDNEVSFNSKFEILESSLTDICFFRDGTSTGGTYEIRQKDSGTDLGTADISVSIATGFIDVIKN